MQKQWRVASQANPQTTEAAPNAQPAVAGENMVAQGARSCEKIDYDQRPRKKQ
jgi:hypothetical protein